VLNIILYDSSTEVLIVSWGLMRHDMMLVLKIWSVLNSMPDSRMRSIVWKYGKLTMKNLRWVVELSTIGIYGGFGSGNLGRRGGTFPGHYDDTEQE
jgi:hypothetical protein